MNHSLSTKGLSMSQAQSISNLCNQRALEIENQIVPVNNYTKDIWIEGKLYIETQGVALPSNIKDLIIEKCKLHACQAFLMENIKAKESMIELVRHSSPDIEESPEYPEQEEIDMKLYLKEVNESWGIDQLSRNELNEFIYAEAYAAHIGRFIHKGGKLDILRKELPTIKTLEWLEIETGKKTPLNVTVHHTSADLLNLHEKLAAEHRKWEQRVNYYKAKIKNLVAIENSRRRAENAKLQDAVSKRNKELNAIYKSEISQWLDKKKKAVEEHGKWATDEINRISKLRIEVDERFQDVINIFLEKLEAEQE